jgi:hypothetical protein
MAQMCSEMSRQGIDRSDELRSDEAVKNQTVQRWELIRTKLRNVLKSFVVGLMVAGGWVYAQAAYVDYRINDGGLKTFNITWDGNTHNALAGGILLTKVGGAADMPASFLSVCTDIGGTLFLGRQYGYSAPTDFSGQGGVRPSWGSGNQGIPFGTPWASMTLAQQQNATAAVNAAANIFYTHQNVLTGGSITEMAALQLAVWEALLDTTAGGGTLDVNNGRFKINPVGWDDDVAIGLATSWLAQVDYTATYTGSLLIPDPTTQFGLPAQGVFYDVTPTVPEPATVMAAALLLLPLGARVVRKFRQNQRV